MPNILGPVAGGQVTTRPARANGYGATQTWWQGCTAPGIEDGTVVDPDALNDFLAQILTAFTQAGIALDGADDMLWRSMRSVGIRYGVDIGAADTLQAVFTPAPVSLTAGMFLAVKAAHSNTGATTLTVTLADANTITKPVKRPDGSPLQTADWPIAMVGLVVFDGVNFQLIASMPSAGSTPASIDVATAPFFPEILTATSKLAVTAATGSVVVDTAQAWQWRGLKKYTATDFILADRTFATAASKAYHLRWHAPGTGLATPLATYPRGRFLLRDLADAAYNPTALAETNVVFDTTYDDMFIAKVVTNGANSPTVTSLVNQVVINADIEILSGYSPGAGDNRHYTLSSTFALSRTPLVYYAPKYLDYQGVPDGNSTIDMDWNIFASTKTRYALVTEIYADYANQFQAWAVVRA